MVLDDYVITSCLNCGVGVLKSHNVFLNRSHMKLLHFGASFKCIFLSDRLHCHAFWV